MNSSSDIIDTKQLENEFNIKPNTAYSLARQRRIPHIRFGSRYLRFRRSEIQKWISGFDLTVEQLKGGKDDR